MLDWLTTRTPVNRPIVPRDPPQHRVDGELGLNDFRCAEILRVYWPTSDAPRPAGALDTRPFEHAGGDHWQELWRRSLISGSLS